MWQAVADAANICCKTTAQFLAGLVMFCRGDSPDKLNSLVDAFKQVSLPSCVFLVDPNVRSDAITATSLTRD